MKPAVFLDRDGVVNEGGLINRPQELRLVPRAAEAIALLKEGGYAIVVVTNQGGMAEGYDGRKLWAKAPLDREGLAAIHDELQRQLGPSAAPDLIKFCPHAVQIKCNCRKPKPGMLRSAAKELGLDLTASYMVGDRTSDLEAGIAAGARPILVLTGDGEKTREESDGLAIVVPTIWEAAGLILSAADQAQA